MKRITVLLRKVVVLGCLAIVPLVFIPEALNGFVLPKWLVIKLAATLLLVLSLPEGRGRMTRLFAAPLDLPVALLILAFGIAWTRSLGTWTGLQTPSQLIALWVIYRAVVAGDSSHREQGKVWRIILLLTAVLSLIALTLVVGGHDEKSRSLLAALLGHGNYAGQWAILVTPIAAAFCMTARGWAERALGAVLLGLSMCYLLISNCRGAWLALAVATSIVVVANWRWVAKRVPKNRLLFLGAIAALAILVSWQAGPLKQRVLSTFSSEDTGMKFRRFAWNSTLKMIAQEPLWGVGSDSFAAYYPRYRSATERSLFPQRRFVRNPHNSYLRAAAEAGPLGLIAILALAIAVLRLGLSGGKRLDRTEQMFRAAAAVGVVATLIHTGVSFNLERPASALYFWAFAGMLSIQARSSVVDAARSSRRRVIGTGLTLLAIIFLAITLFVDAKRIMASIHAPKGSQYKRQGDLLKAEAELRAAVRLWPEAPNCPYLLAKVMLQRDDLPACEEHNRNALALWPHFRDALLDIGIVRWRQSRLDDAEKFVALSLDVDPTFVRARIALGNIYTMKGQYSGAIQQYEYALQRRFSRARAHYHIAVAEAARGRMNEAVEALEKALWLREGFLDKSLRITVTASQLTRYLSSGEKLFRVVVRDADMLAVWDGEVLGAAILSTSRPRIWLMAKPDGVAIKVSEDGERMAFRFREVADGHVYSLVVDEGGVEKSFDLMADAELHAQGFAFYGQILSSLGESDRTKQMCLEALRLDPKNALAQKQLERQRN